MDKISNYKRKEFCRDLVETYASADFIQGIPSDAFGLNAAVEMLQEAETEANAGEDVVAAGEKGGEDAAAAVDLTGEEQEQKFAAPEAPATETQTQAQAHAEAQSQTSAPTTKTTPAETAAPATEAQAQAQTSTSTSGPAVQEASEKRRRASRLRTKLGPSSAGSVAFGVNLATRRCAQKRSRLIAYLSYYNYIHYRLIVSSSTTLHSIRIADT